VNFAIMAFAVFLVVRMMNRMSGTPVEADKA
jgi:large-conductance mechanosensitive channel